MSRIRGEDLRRGVVRAEAEDLRVEDDVAQVEAEDLRVEDDVVMAEEVVISLEVDNLEDDFEEDAELEELDGDM